MFDSKTNMLLDFIGDIFTYAHIKGHSIFLIGGFAVDIAYGEITRNHHDIDLMVFENDLKMWENWFVSRGFTRTSFKTKSQNYCFILQKDSIHIDIGGFYYEGNQVFDRCDIDENPFLWPEPKTTLIQKSNAWFGTTLYYANPNTILTFKTSNSNRILRDIDIHDISLLRQLCGNKYSSI